MARYARTLDELREKAVMFWPDAILAEAGEASVLPLLLKTQASFIGLLQIANASPTAWKGALETNKDLTPPLFLKHLMVLSDLGGEALNKLPPVTQFFPGGVITYLWSGKEHKYKFAKINVKCPLTNTALGVSAKKLLAPTTPSKRIEDVVMLLLYGFSAYGDTLPSDIKDRCIIGSYIGQKALLERFVDQAYIRVSKQIGGADANMLGQLAQNYVVSSLKNRLNGWSINRNATLPNVGHKGDGSETNFDVVAVSPNDRWFGIEVSFQVTTNSVVERKSREAQKLQAAVHAENHKICYVIDGAGNILIRHVMASNICKFSDCTVAMSESEMDILAEYLRKEARVD